VALLCTAAAKLLLLLLSLLRLHGGHMRTRQPWQSRHTAQEARDADAGGRESGWLADVPLLHGCTTS
jgi:hypothetical protein